MYQGKGLEFNRLKIAKLSQYNFFTTKCAKIIHRDLRFFRDDARKKWPLMGSKYADNLSRFQVSGFGCQEGESQNPET
jgi:hypothetical protein